MIWRKIIPVLIACFSVSAPAALNQQVLLNHAPAVVPFTASGIEELKETVIPITQLGFGVGIEARYGTGFCLDPECRFIGTNYHVAKIARLRKIEGEKVKNLYLATGPKDEGATQNAVGPRVMGYNFLRDLAVFELQHPLRHRHGIAFSLRELQSGQEVDIYAYSKDPTNPVRKLQQFTGTYEGHNMEGLLYFTYDRSVNQPIRGGASGGIVVDRDRHQIVGILNGIAMDGEAVASAVPVQALAEFVIRVRPYLAQALFPSTQGISPIAADFYPEFAPTPAEILEHRREENPAVKLLRSKAQAMSDSMRDFIAVQTFAWGQGPFEPVAQAAYEVQVLDGNQRFRSYPDGRKLFRDVPDPDLNTEITSGGEWSELPGMVGTELSLHIRQAPDVVLKEQRMKVFQYRGSVEDDVCHFRKIFDFIVFAIKKDLTVDCYGEVWTDEETNILRISEHYKLLGKWEDYEGVVAYGWLQRAGKPWLVPLTISTEGKYRGKVYWCRGQFMDYSMFGAQARIVANEVTTSPSVPPVD